jgi:hypothetical protein
VVAGGRGKNFFRGFFFWALSLFLLGMGMKLLMMQRCVNPLPYFDQWEGEAAAIYVPYFEHELGLGYLCYPQNEHRIFFTHIYDLALLLLNGQWDSQLQMILNAVIHCATVAGFAWLMATIMGRLYWVPIWLAGALVLLSPFSWENALQGFQSQFYFLLLFSLLAIWFLRAEVNSPRWRLGVLCGICALFTMASGLLAAVTVAALLVIEIVKDRKSLRGHLPSLVICAVLAVAGVLLKGKHPQEGNWHAHSLGDFVSSLGNNLSWPTGLIPWLAPLNLFPLVLLAWVYLRSPEKNQPAEWMILGIGLWTILQSLTTAYARGNGGAPPTWRYMDTLSFLFVANLLSVALVVGNYRRQLRFPVFWYAAFVVWLVPCVLSLWTLNKRAWDLAIPSWAGHQRVRLETFRAFMATDDPAVFANHDERDVPWVYIPELVYLLRTKDIRPILPACGRDPLKLTPSDGNASAFVTNGRPDAVIDAPTERSLGSFTQAGNAARGTFESAPMVSSLPYLEFQVAGNLCQPGLSLQLISLSSGQVTEVRPAHEPGNRWVNVDVKAPSDKFKVVARDDSATGWFAFKEPREMGRLSFWAAQAPGTARYLMTAGFLCLAVALVTYCLPQPRKENQPVETTTA